MGKYDAQMRAAVWETQMELWALGFTWSWRMWAFQKRTSKLEDLNVSLPLPFCYFLPFKQTEKEEGRQKRRERGWRGL